MTRRTTRWSFLFGATLVLAALWRQRRHSPAASDDGGGGGTTATSAPGSDDRARGDGGPHSRQWQRSGGGTAATSRARSAT